METLIDSQDTILIESENKVEITQTPDRTELVRCTKGLICDTLEA